MLFRFFVVRLFIGFLFIVYAGTTVYANVASRISVTLPTGTSVDVPVHVIGKQQYVLISDLALRVFPGSVYDPSGGEIRMPNQRIRFAPTSFYIVRDEPAGESVAQMPLPTLTIRKAIFAPTPYVFKALETLKFFLVDEHNGIRLRQFPEKRQTDGKKSTASVVEQKKMEIIPPYQENKQQTSIAAKPGNYRIPIDLEKPSQERLLHADAGQFAESVIPKKIPPAIQSITIMKMESGYSIKISADRPIPIFQKPEIVQGSIVKFRIPNVATQVKNNTIEYPKGIEGVHTDIIRDIFVVSVKCENTVEEAVAERDGANALKITLKTTATIEKNPKSKKEHSSLPVIILDPGHGGEDVGAIGIGGVYEKDITLSVAKKTKKYIEEQIPGIKVILTREKDVFLALRERTEFANKHKGMLFISIHCNAAPSKPHPANGFEVYVLRPGKTKDAIRVAERENSVVALEKNAEATKKLSEEQLILATMAQSAFVKLSDKFAAMLKSAVNKKTDLVNRGIAQAGFYVLVGASMPNVLVELAFITNEKDVQYLTSEEGQKELALALTESIKEFTASAL